MKDGVLVGSNASPATSHHLVREAVDASDQDVQRRTSSIARVANLRAQIQGLHLTSDSGHDQLVEPSSNSDFSLESPHSRNMLGAAAQRNMMAAPRISRAMARRNAVRHLFHSIFIFSHASVICPRLAKGLKDLSYLPLTNSSLVNGRTPQIFCRSTLRFHAN